MIWLFYAAISVVIGLQALSKYVVKFLIAHNNKTTHSTSLATQLLVVGEIPLRSLVVFKNHNYEFG